MTDGLGRRSFLWVTAGSVLGTTAVGRVPASRPRSQEAGTVIGLVTDLDENPIAGAEVTLLDGDTEEATTTTDENGQYGLAAPPGTYELTVEKEEYAPFSTDVTIEEEGQQVTVNVTLEPPDPGAVLGVVRDEFGNRVGGAEVALFDGDTEVATTQTDADGQYAVAAGPGSYVIEVWKIEFEPVSAEVTVESGGVTILEFELPPGPPPLPGFENPPLDPDGDGHFEDVDGDGAFTIFDVQALFDNLDSAPVQNNPVAFNFNGDENPDGVTIFDVQALFEELQESD